MCADCWVLCCERREPVPDYTGDRVKQRGSMILWPFPARPSKTCKAFNLYKKTYFGGNVEAALAAVQKQDDKKYKCVLCHDRIYGDGHNPAPLSNLNIGKCCAACNQRRVMPARAEQLLDDMCAPSPLLPACLPDCWVWCVDCWVAVFCCAQGV